MNIFYYDEMQEAHYEERIRQIYVDQYLLPQNNYMPTPVIIISCRDCVLVAVNKDALAICCNTDPDQKMDPKQITNNAVFNAAKTGLFDLINYTVETYRDTNDIPYIDWHEGGNTLEQAQEIARRQNEEK